MWSGGSACSSSRLNGCTLNRTEQPLLVGTVQITSEGHSHVLQTEPDWRFALTPTTEMVKHMSNQICRKGSIRVQTD